MTDDEAPEGYTQERWDNLCCCACYGCQEHEHTCHLSEEKRAEAVRYHDEALTIALSKGPGDHLMSDGTILKVRGRKPPTSDGQTNGGKSFDDSSS